MGTLSLMWEYLGEQPVELYFALVPWHLVVVMVVLALLAATGIHHILATGPHTYTLRGSSLPWLGAPTLLVLVVALLVLLACYALAVRAPELVRLSLENADDEVARDSVGGVTLAPILGDPALFPRKGPIAREALVAAIRSTNTRTLLQRYRAMIPPPETETAVPAQTQPGTAGAGSPGGTAEQGAGKPVAGDKGTSAQPGAASADKAAPQAAKQPPAKDQGRQAEPAPAARGAATAEAKPPAAGATTESHGGTAATEHAGQPALREPAPMGPTPGAEASSTLELLALHWLIDPDHSGAEAPRPAPQPAQGQPQAPAQPELLPEFLAGLVSEIKDGVTLEREKWEHIAGTRFLSESLVPWLTSKYRQIAGLVALVDVLAVAAYLFLLIRFVRWLNKSGGAPDAQSKERARSASSPPRSKQPA